MAEPPRLSWTQRMSYGVGHALNDLTASMWFSYLIVYLQLILRFDSTNAGVVLLVGQIADAVFTPLLGFEVSEGKDYQFCNRYGRRKFLHLIGTICVTISFPFIFSRCLGCENSSERAMMLMLVPLVIIFQFGWAATQVSHLSLIPVITPYESERDLLNVIRFAVDIMADVSIYVIVWMVFDMTRAADDTSKKITPEYANKFLLIVVTVVAIGLVFSVIFQIGVKEVHRVAPSTVEIEQEANSLISSSSTYSDKTNLTWKDWLKEVHFYQVGLLYMFVKLFQNMGSVFTPLYLQESLGADDDLIAKVPLVMNVSGFAMSIFLPKLFKLINKKFTFLVGAIIGIGGCGWISVGDGYPFCAKGIYGVAVLLGSSTSMLTVSSLSFIHDLIGTSVESSAFVYGCMSFCDKLANGVAGMAVQQFHSIYCVDCNWFYKKVMSYGIGSAIVLSCLILLTIMSAKLGERKSSQNRILRTLTLPESTAAVYGSIECDRNEDHPKSQTNV